MNHKKKKSVFLCFVLAVFALSFFSLGNSSYGMEKKKIVAGDDYDYAPFSFLSNGQPVGFNIDLMRAVCEEVGLDVTIVLKPWNEVREDLEKGKIDALCGMFNMPERRNIADFTVPHSVVNHGIFVRSDSRIHSVHDISNREIIVQQGAGPYDYFVSHHITQDFILVPTQSEALLKLAQGEGDCAVVTKFQGLYLIRQIGITNVKVLSQPIIPFDYCFAVQKGDWYLQSLLNEGLAIVKANGRYEKIYNRWLSIYQANEVDYDAIRKIVLQIITPIVALLLFFTLWSQALRYQVNQKTKKIQEQLKLVKSAESRFREIFEKSGDAICVIQEGKLAATNPRFEEIFSGTSEEIRKRNRELVEKIVGASNQPELSSIQFKIPGLESGEKTAELDISISSIIWDGQEAILCIIRDISLIKQMEARLQQSIKMEAVGRLAGGIAHDFNNLLTVIGGNVGISLFSVNEKSPVYQNLLDIQSAVNRASDLTNQLLSFSRNQIILPQILDLGAVVKRVESMLQRIIGEDIRLKMEIESNLWNVKADPAQIEQVVMNLAANARDALPDGGEIVIEIRNVASDTISPVFRPTMPEGDYLLLKFSDNGVGIPPEHQAHIFEPFFTTKPVNKGTGLGLSIVFGIVKQSNGYIGVKSQSNEGTQFELFFPRHESQVSPASSYKDQTNEQDFHGSERILIVEDNPLVRKTVRLTLESHGYWIMEAKDGIEGLELAKSLDFPLDMVVTDIIMPHLKGDQFAIALRKFLPDIKILFISGFADNTSIAQIPKSTLIKKPFNSKDLLMKIRLFLDKHS